MKAILRNFLSVLRRYSLATALNLFGLSIGFVAFLVIMMQVNYERTFDRCYPTTDRIVRVDCNWGADYSTPILARGMLDAVLASSPQIEAGTLLNPWIGEVYLSVGDSMDRQGFREPMFTCYPDLPVIFGFDFIEGNPDCLKDPEKVIIPQSMARRMFGDEPALDATIYANERIWTKDSLRSLVVGGVYKDLPMNTQLDNAIYSTTDNASVGDWDSRNYFCYLLLDSQADIDVLEANLNQTFDFGPVRNPEKQALSFNLLPLPDIYYSQLNGGDKVKSGSADSMRTLLFVALLVILVAAINFTNFSIALAPRRVRSINTQKVFGSSTGFLRMTLTVEALITAFLAWLFSLLIVELLDQTQLLSFIEADMNIMHNLPLVGITGAIALLTGLISGLYPAYYTTSFQPAVVLKGSFALSPAGRFLRTGLIGFQYIFSICLIIAAIFVQLQNTYMRDYNQGFDKEQIVLADIGAAIYNKNKDVYVNRLKTHPGIEDVGFSRLKLGGSDSYSQYRFTYLEKEFHGYTMEISYNLLDVLGIPVEQGRNFTASDEIGKNDVTLIFNQAQHRSLPIEPGTLINGYWNNTECKVAGITGDVKITSLRQGDDHIIFLVNSPISMPVSYVRLKAGANVSDAMHFIRETVAGIDPTFPLEVELYDQVFDQLYQKESNLNRSITVLSLLAILISIVGVFGLVLFETQYRRKEISIRKVHGASVGSILLMFNKVYLKIVSICFVLAAPLAYYAITRWLENFAYKTPVYWWVFAIAFSTVAIITALIVTFQNWSAANTNPSVNIRTE